MNTTKLKDFARKARRTLIDETTKKLTYIMHAQTPEALEQKKILAAHGFSDDGKDDGSLFNTGVTKEELIEKVAYTWFNRLCALRYMDIKGYTDCGILTEKEGFTQPEILTEAKNGTLPASIERHTDMAQLNAILDGRTGENNRDAAAYRLLLKGACNYYHSIMPFMFEPIDDYTERLLIDDCLSENSLIAELKDALDTENCENVEVIGWLYQYYISEKKERVFDEVKTQRRKVRPSEIPAVTQLFTPDWIVEYLVDNTLGRLWMANHPDSNLTAKMRYYIEPEADETVLSADSPEDIRICDPACGSGHMLTYTFDLLFEIYMEELYSPKDAVHAILTKNLKGFEVDNRAGELAQFALYMKARERYDRLFRKAFTPDIVVFENIIISDEELTDFENDCGELSKDFKKLIRQMANARSFGSLINPEGVDLKTQHEQIRASNPHSIMAKTVRQRLLKSCELLEQLNERFDIVITNPPYLGNFHGDLKKFVEAEYKDEKTDLNTCFIKRNTFFAIQKGYVGMVTMQSWMFLSSYQNFRKFLIDEKIIQTMFHLGTRAFDAIGGEVVSTTAFTLRNLAGDQNTQGLYVDLRDGKSETEKIEQLTTIKIGNGKGKYIVSQEDLKKIPGTPIAYWVSDKFRELFKLEKKLGDVASPRQGMATSDNNRFLRFWNEVSLNRVGFGFASREAALESGLKWFPYNKGGAFRKWYGNNEYLVNWENDGEEIKKTVSFKYPYLNGNTDFVVKNQQYYFKEGITYTFVSSSAFGSRYTDKGFLFDVGGSSMFPKKDYRQTVLSYLNSKLTFTGLKSINPTLNFQVGNLKQLPYKEITDPNTKAAIEETAKRLIALSKEDWDSYERSWDFKRHPLLNAGIHSDDIAEAYCRLREHWASMTEEMHRLEEQNNELFIDVYGLDGEMSKDVSLREVSLTCNPEYRYPATRNKPFDPVKAEARLKTDTVKELIAYGVGCVFGRYALDKDGLILASQGETLEDYLARVPDPSFMPDADNAVPILAENWFADDLTALLEEFLKVAFGAERFGDNLAFIEEALGKGLQAYLLKDFIKDHIQVCHKRPIYWLFSSPKKHFNLLIYMHRYTSDTVSVVLKYLREFRDKVNAEIAAWHNVSVNASDASEKTDALKKVDRYSEIVRDLEDYENTLIFPLASERFALDLDDGVAVNYAKFGKALFKITGVNDK